MEEGTRNFALVVAVMGIFYLVIRNYANPTFSTFLLYLIITIITRFPKVTLTDPFMLTDSAELFIFMTAITMGYPLALLMLVMGIWIPVLFTKIESPRGTVIRTGSTLVALGAFSILLHFGVAVLTAIALGIFISSIIWATLLFFLGLTNPTFFLIALAKPVIFYRILHTIGCC